MTEESKVVTGAGQPAPGASPADDRVAELQHRLADSQAAARRARSELNQSQEQLDRLMNLYVAMSQLHASLDPQRVQETISEIAVDLLGVRAFVVLLRDAGTGETAVAFVHGEAHLPPSAPRTRYRGGDPLIDQALLDGRLSFGPTGESRAEAAIPLTLDGRPVGALVVYALLAQKAGLADADRDLLELLAAHAATALVATRVYARADRKLKTLEGLIQLRESDPQAGSGALSGSLGDLSFAELVQFIHYSERTGTLRVVNDGRQGRLAFYQGRVLEARAPGVPSLLDALIIDGVLPPRLVAAARKRAAELRVPPATLLLRTGHLPEEALRKAVRRQIEAAIGRLLGWQRGHFEFSVGKVELKDLTLDDARRLVLVHTQMLLLDALRKEDEAGRATGALDADALAGLALDAPAVAVAASPSQDDFFDEEGGGPAEVLTPPDPVRRALQEMRIRLATSGVSVQLMDLVAAIAERAVLFVVRKSDLVPIGAFGDAADGRPLIEHLGELVLALPPRGELARELGTGRPLRLELPDPRVSAHFLDAVGRPASGTAAIIPVTGSNRPVLVVYADNGDKPEPVADLEMLELLCTPLGLALENELLRRRVSSLSRR